MATTAAQAILGIMLVAPMNCGGIAEQEERLIGAPVPVSEQEDKASSVGNRTHAPPLTL
jgi:hypothetical protein